MLKFMPPLYFVAGRVLPRLLSVDSGRQVRETDAVSVFTLYCLLAAGMWSRPRRLGLVPVSAQKVSCTFLAGWRVYLQVRQVGLRVQQRSINQSKKICVAPPTQS